MLDLARIAKIQQLKDRVEDSFDAGDWILLATYLGDSGAIISQHPRLLRSLNFGDEDYPSCVAEVLGKIIDKEPQALGLIESMLDGKPSSNDCILPRNGFSTCSGDAVVDTSLASVMMPFQPAFSDVRESLKRTCSSVGLNLRAADDVWNNTVLIQDIFDLITKSCVVIVDFTGRNPNVMYETGIAHALGKEVVPITQSLEDVPFDLKHHRILCYDNNTRGRGNLEERLSGRLRTIMSQHNWAIPF